MVKTNVKEETVEIVNLAPLLLVLDRFKKESSKSLGENKDLKDELSSKIDSIIKEKEVKTVGEKVDDLVEIISKSPEIENGSQVGIMAKKIELEAEEIIKQYPKEVESLRKEEFINEFEKQAKEINPNLDEKQLKDLSDYGKLIAENSFEENILDGSKNEALEANKRIFSPGKLENAWTDLRQTVNFLQKSPEEIKNVKEKYNNLRENLRKVKIPDNFREVRSFEKVMSAFDNPDNDQLFSRTKKYLGWADRVDKLTGGWLNKTVTEAGLKYAGKIGNQAVQEFAKNSLNVVAKEGFQKGFNTVLSGILKGGVKVGTTAAKSAAATGAAAGGAAAATGATAATGVGLPVAAVMAAIQAAIFLKKQVGKIAEKLGISAKRFFEENFGKVGGKVMGGITTLIALPTVLIGSLSVAFLGPILAIVLGGMFVYQMFQGSLVSSLVPPKGEIEYENIFDNEEGSYTNIVYSDSPKVVCSYDFNGVTLYVFEAGSTGGRMTERYDLAKIDNGEWLQSVGNYALGYNNKLDKRVIPAYIAMVEAGKASGQLSRSDDLLLISGYRSVSEQWRLWYDALEKYGSAEEAGKWASDPNKGLSAHASGRAIDIRVCGGTRACGGIESQKRSSTFRWLEANAWKYGFYNYWREPWHWEYNPIDRCGL